MSSAPVSLKRVLASDVKSLNLDPVDDTTRAQAADIISKAGGPLRTAPRVVLTHARPCCRSARAAKQRSSTLP